MKILIRCLMLNSIISTIIAKILPPLHIKSSLEELAIKDYLIVFWILSVILGGLFLLGYLIYHLAKTQFQNKFLKPTWFITFFVGIFFNFAGPIIYYVLVYELKLGTKKAA